MKSRLEHGFRHHFRREVGGRMRDPFAEMGLRSETLLSIAVQYFVACVPKGGRLRSSMDKANLGVQARSKVLALDYPWIEANKQVLSVIRIDCDRVFESPQQCVMALRELVGDRLPCMPHLVTGDLRPDGRYSRPHLYFLLPVGHGVWNDPEDSRCRMDIVRLFHAVSLGLVSALIDLGADPCAPVLTLRGKNPLSPYWHTICPNDDVWPTLADYADWVDLSASREKLARRAGGLQSGLGIEGSNALFNALRREAFAILRQWHFSADPRGKGEFGRIADELHQALIASIPDRRGGLTETQVDLLIAKIADYAAGAWDASKLETSRKARGRLLHVTEGISTVRARQATGAVYASATKAERALSVLVDAYIRVRGAGSVLTQTAVAAEAGVHRRTAIRRWREVLEAVGESGEGCDNRCIDKKVGQDRPYEDRQSIGASCTAKPESTGDGMAVGASVATISPELIEPDRSDWTAQSLIPATHSWNDDHQCDSHGDIQDDTNDDMTEIEAKEAWLAALEYDAPRDPLEPDDGWFDEMAGQRETLASTG